MNPVSLLFRAIIGLQIRGKSLADLIQAAQTDGQAISARVADKPDSPGNRTQLRHIIGIERWGQRRLQTMLGEPPIYDEYDGYQPAENLDLAALRQEFTTTRAETLAIVGAIQQAGVAQTGLAYHNGMGDLSLAMWLRYLNLHANLESRRFK
jgi:hypothetical protein